MFEFLRSLIRRYQAYRYSKVIKRARAYLLSCGCDTLHLTDKEVNRVLVMKQLRAHLSFFGWDTSHLTDEEIEQGIWDASNIIASSGVTVDEAAVAIQKFKGHLQEMRAETP